MSFGYNDVNTNSGGIQASVTGLVTASGWDAYNNVTELRLLTTDEDEFIIEGGILLINVLRKLIHAKGFIKKDPYGVKSIEIKEFKILE